MKKKTLVKLDKLTKEFDVISENVNSVHTDVITNYADLIENETNIKSIKTRVEYIKSYVTGTVNKVEEKDQLSKEIIDSELTEKIKENTKGLKLKEKVYLNLIYKEGYALKIATVLYSLLFILISAGLSYMAFNQLVSNDMLSSMVILSSILLGIVYTLLLGLLGISILGILTLALGDKTSDKNIFRILYISMYEYGFGIENIPNYMVGIYLKDDKYNKKLLEKIYGVNVEELQEDYLNGINKDVNVLSKKIDEIESIICTKEQEIDRYKESVNMYMKLHNNTSPIV